ncbi:MAG: hypothetical protein Q7J54_00305 [Candidatus Woesearchaeota archaeon]|nr:hypothetical protein [Candidatus Woesearchaeota archaeon]
MQGENKEKQVQRIQENIGNKPVTYLESQQNLIGFFSILLDEARRINPEKYLDGYRKSK